MMKASSTAADIVSAVKAGHVSPCVIIEDALARIASLNAELGAFTDVLHARARERAEAIERRLKNREGTGSLAGVPFAAKNLFDIQGLRTLAGSKINRDHAPAVRDAAMIAHLEAEDAILVGALNMGEFAYDFTGENSHYGPSRNPHDLQHMSGGSSGGSAAAVSAGLVPLSLATDTNGSIRVPASFCGIFGIKPTYGRLSRRGTFPFVNSLDHVGAMARSVGDLALAYDAMQGDGRGDPVCVPREPQFVTDGLSRGLENLRIGIATDYFLQNGSESVTRAVEKFAYSVGAKERLVLPHVHRARAAAAIITAAEAANLHAPTLAARAADYDPEVRDRLLAGALLPSTWLLQAQRFRRWYETETLKLFRKVDVIIAPAAPIQAPKIGQKLIVLDDKEIALRPSIGLYTQPISFIGLPVVVVPTRDAGELPIGIQIIAAPWREDIAFRVASSAECAGLLNSSCNFMDR